VNGPSDLSLSFAPYRTGADGTGFQPPRVAALPFR